MAEGAQVPGPPLLELQALASPHGGPFDLCVQAGECVAVVGRSGAGKSVLLRLIADLDPHQGEVRLDGMAQADCPAPHWRRQVVYQAAEPGWWCACARQHFRDADLPLVEALLPELGLDSALLDQDIARLSTGERQRMALVRSLVCRPRVLLLDEPTGALDQASTLAVEALLARRLHQGLAMVMVTHSREQAARLGHRVVELRDRRIHPL